MGLIHTLRAPSTSDELRCALHLLLLDQFCEEVTISIDDEGRTLVRFVEDEMPTTFAVCVRAAAPVLPDLDSPTLTPDD